MRGSVKCSSCQKRCLCRFCPNNQTCKFALRRYCKAVSYCSINRKLKAYISCEHAPTVPTGKGAKPQHEFDVRGHMRHYKSGKVVYIRPYTKCKGRGTKIIHEYITGGNTDE